MYIDIYFNAESDIERDLLEERLDEILKGKGQVTGGGAGKDGVNIDIEIDDDCTESNGFMMFKYLYVDNLTFAMFLKYAFSFKP